MLTTLATVKARLGIQDSDVKDDALLTQFIALVSARFENDCNRTFTGAPNVTEEFEGDETEIRVARYPIDETAAITFDLQASAVTGWEAQASVDYIVRKGCVISLSAKLATWRTKARVTYTGGYALPDDTGVGPALPDDLQYAAVEQVAYVFQNKDRLGISSMSGQGGSINQFSKLDLLPSVAATLAKYERWTN